MNFLIKQKCKCDAYTTFANLYKDITILIIRFQSGSKGQFIKLDFQFLPSYNRENSNHNPLPIYNNSVADDFENI